MSVLDVPALTNTQLRAAALAVSAASLPLPTGAAVASLQPALVNGTIPVSNKNITTTGNLSSLSSTLNSIAGSLATIGLQVSGTGVGFTLTPQASQDGGLTYINVGVLIAGANSTSTPVTSISTNGNWKFSSGSYTHFQLINTVASTSGTVTATLSATNALDVVRVSGIGDQADTSTSWYTQVGSLLSNMKLLIAATVDAGSHTYSYTNGYVTSNAWTLFGTTRTRTYTYTGTLLTYQSDWV